MRNMGEQVVETERDAVLVEDAADFAVIVDVSASHPVGRPRANRYQLRGDRGR